MRPYFLILAFLLLASPIRAASYSIADNAFVGLLGTRGPVAMSLGNAESAIPQDSEALDENPAALAQDREVEVGLGHIQLFQDSSLEMAQVRGNLENSSGYGLQIHYLDDGSIQERDANGEPLGASFLPWGLDIKGGLAWSLSPNFDLGASLGYVEQSIDTESQKGFELGFGSLFTLDEAWRLAAGLRDWGGGVGENPFPSTVYLGVAHATSLARNQEIFLLGQGEFGFDGNLNLNIALQYDWKQLFFLRTGYSFPLEDNSLSGLSGLGAGLGAHVYSCQVDYGISFQGDLGTIQGLTLSYFFSEGVTRGRSSQSSDSAGVESLEMARKLQSQGQSIAAAQAYLAYLHSNPKDKDAWFELGKIYLAANQKEDAKRCLQWAISIDPNDENLKRELANIK